MRGAWPTGRQTGAGGGKFKVADQSAALFFDGPRREGDGRPDERLQLAAARTARASNRPARTSAEINVSPIPAFRVERKLLCLWTKCRAEPERMMNEREGRISLRLSPNAPGKSTRGQTASSAPSCASGRRPAGSLSLKQAPSSDVSDPISEYNRIIDRKLFVVDRAESIVLIERFHRN